MSDNPETPDPDELPDDPTQTAGEAVGMDPDAIEDADSASPAEDLEDDPAYSFDNPEADYKGG